MDSVNFTNCHQLWMKRSRKQNESGREAYKDVRPAPLDVRQRGTPELGFSFAKDVSRGNLFRACRRVRSELPRKNGWGWVWLCQMPNFTRDAPYPFIFRDDDGRRRFPSFFFLLWPSCLFYSYSFFLSFPLFLSLSAVERSFNRKSYGSLASASASANTQLILQRRAKGKILARSQTFPRRKRESGWSPIVSGFSI